MKRYALTLCLTVFLPQMAVGEDCPAAPDHIAGVDALISQAQAAKSQADARAISGQMWELWTDAPDARAQAMLDRGMRQREAWNLAGAYKELDELVTYCPNYAEGYNQRAFVSYLQQDFPAALRDLDAAIALSPNHVAALSGRALTLLGLKRLDEAREALTYALELNPWLSERALLEPGGLLDPPGEDI